MKTLFKNREYESFPWKPQMGRVFDSAFTFDTETTLIDNERSWLTPAYVLGAAFNGTCGVFIPRNRLVEFFAVHTNNTVVFHNAAFDLDVIATAEPVLNIYDRVDSKRVIDTQLMHRLLTLGEAGHTSQGKGESTLEHCAATYLGVELPKDTMDSRGGPVRLSYGKWLGRPLNEMEPVYLEYLANDLIATWHVYEALRARTTSLLGSAENTWGYGSPHWLQDCIERFGPQTHDIQLKAAIVLRSITANGLHLDVARCRELEATLQKHLQTQKSELREYGYIAGGKGSNTSLQAVLKCRSREFPTVSFPLTESGQFATAHDALQDLIHTDPFVKLLLEHRETEKLLGSFVGKMAKSVLHPSFNALVVSGRTSSFGEINAQNLPKTDVIRTCVVPRSGHEFIDADYATVELATLAQACQSQFGLDSKMAHAINAGEDLHKLVAARMLNKSPEFVTREERQKAKPVNFGKPGGMGLETLIAYAKVNYGVLLSQTEAETLSESWMDLFPEMHEFLGDKANAALELASLLDLTPASHFESTNDRRFVSHRCNLGREETPHEILGAMLLKTVKEPNPKTHAGNPYSEADCEYFWSRLNSIADRMPKSLQMAIRMRQASRKLQRAVMGLVGRDSVFTYSGRLRDKATYSARHNTIFQGLAADGAKLALWRLWRAGFGIVNFIHDEVLVEIPTSSACERMKSALAVRQHMIDGMQEVVPDVKIEVNYAAMTRWYKDATCVLDPAGTGLLLWVPQQEAEATVDVA